MVTTLLVSLIQAKVFSEKMTTVTLISTGDSKKKPLQVSNLLAIWHISVTNTRTKRKDFYMPPYRRILIINNELRLHAEQL